MFSLIFDYILSDFVKIVQEIIRSSIQIINDLSINTKIDVINFNYLIISMINVYDYFKFNLLILFFSFEIFSTIDGKFKIEKFQRFSC